MLSIQKPTVKHPKWEARRRDVEWSQAVGFEKGLATVVVPNPILRERRRATPWRRPAARAVGAGAGAARACVVSGRVRRGFGRAHPDGARDRRHGRDDVDALLDSRCTPG